MKQTKQDVSIDFKGYGKITVPKGTRVTSQTACGVDPNYNFVADLSWIPLHDNGCKQFGLIHDATYYGINIDKKYIEEV